MSTNILSVGTNLQIEIVRGNVHYCFPVSVLGYSADNDLMVSSPSVDHELRVGDQFAVRVLGEASYVFTSELLRVQRESSGCICLKGPARDVVRNTPRVPVNEPSINLTMSEGPDTVEVRFADISRCGACLICEKRLGGIDDEFTVVVHSPVTNRLVKVECTIRYVRNDNDDGDFHHGVRFERLDGDAQQFIDWVLRKSTNAFTQGMA